MEIQSEQPELKDEIERLRDLALEELPDYVENENEARAWTARRMLEISERERKTKQTTQALLATWISNGEYGKLWMDHPDHPETFREFLQSVGNDRENNKLNPSVISNMVSIAEVIVPFCESNGIKVNGFITTSLWTKFSEAIPALKRASRDGNASLVNDILNDVRALPTRDALRYKYRKQRDTDSVSVSDIIYNGKGRSVVVTVVDTDDLQLIKAALSKVTSWDQIASGNVNGKVASLKVKI